MAPTPYPKIGTKAWIALRSRAASSPSTKFTPEFVVALMGMANPNSALTNTVGPMRRLGLIDEDGALTERGNKWRLDESHADACQEILDDIYPEEFGVLVDDDGRPDLGKVKAWLKQTGLGEANAQQMANTYVMVARKQPPEPPVKDSGKAKRKAPSGTDTAEASPKAKTAEGTHAVAAHEPVAPPARSDGGPTVHLDIQIHIPADATPDQIDQIFASMARHLYAK